MTKPPVPMRTAFAGLGQRGCSRAYRCLHRSLHHTVSQRHLPPLDPVTPGWGRGGCLRKRGFDLSYVATRADQNQQTQEGSSERVLTLRAVLLTAGAAEGTLPPPAYMRAWRKPPCTSTALHLSSHKDSVGVPFTTSALCDVEPELERRDKPTGRAWPGGGGLDSKLRAVLFHPELSDSRPGALQRSLFSGRCRLDLSAWWRLSTMGQREGRGGAKGWIRTPLPPPFLSQSPHPTPAPSRPLSFHPSCLIVDGEPILDWTGTPGSWSFSPLSWSFSTQGLLPFFAVHPSWQLCQVWCTRHPEISLGVP